jgi:hypothetical protein
LGHLDSREFFNQAGVFPAVQKKKKLDNKKQEFFA